MSQVLVGDVGGTHARLGLLRLEDGGFVAPPVTLPCSAYGSLDSLLAAFLDERGPMEWPSGIALAVAGPVTDGAASLTNLAWSVSEAGLRQAGFARAVVLNDYEALALAAPHLSPADIVSLGPSLPTPRRGTVAVLGPGTGFGAAAYCVDARGAAVLVTEGGHMGFAPADEVEFKVWRILAARFGGRVSLERILSGPGLVNLYTALAEIEGAPAAYADPAAVLASAQSGDALATAAVQRFCTILGAAAGDFALAYGAVGGVMLAGGIAPRMLDMLAAGGFRAAFERKGRLAAYLSAIPTGVIVHPYLALLGAAESLRRTP